MVLSHVAVYPVQCGMTDSHILLKQLETLLNLCQKLAEWYQLANEAYFRIPLFQPRIFINIFIELCSWIFLLVEKNV